MEMLISSLKTVFCTIFTKRITAELYSETVTWFVKEDLFFLHLLQNLNTRATTRTSFPKDENQENRSKLSEGLEIVWDVHGNLRFSSLVFLSSLVIL